jgi:transposase
MVYNRFNRWSGRGILAANFLRRWRARRSRPKRWRRTAPTSKLTAALAAEKGASEQVIGVTKGGRSSKLYALVDELCRPWVIILTPGNIADCMVGPECASLRAGIKKLLGDKAYDSDSFRELLRQDGITPVIPVGRIARNASVTTKKPTRAATSSSAATADSKILGALPRAATNSLQTFLPAPGRPFIEQMDAAIACAQELGAPVDRRQ